jgi:hypothetical protein
MDFYTLPPALDTFGSGHDIIAAPGIDPARKDYNG